VDEHELFVGYLPVPPGIRRRVHVVIAALVVLVPVLALVAVTGSGSTGNAERGVPTPDEGIVGRFEAEPYAVLWVAREGGEPEPVLLVGQGKHGVPDHLDSLDGALVRVHGYVLEREGQRMVELAGEPERVDGDSMPLASRERISGGEVVVVGEVVDEKCWLGRMRPGAGRTHRGCAQLCVAGGIPPVLVGRDATGALVRALVVDEDGAAASDWIVPFVAEPLRVRGELLHDGPLTYLRVAPSGLERL
jgi:hypothetical protein